MDGEVMSVSRLRMGTDGKGISTLVTLFGCPLKCRYCINNYCHNENTPRAAYTPYRLTEVLKKDDIYYKMTGGGVVFGGGEPLLQSEFIAEVFRRCDHGWKKRIETSLNVPWKNIEPLIGLTDEWIVDIKDADDEIYRKYTGCSNADILYNLVKLKDAAGTDKILIRVPHIPEYNNRSDVDNTKKWVRENIGAEAEEFFYQDRN